MRKRPVGRPKARGQVVHLRFPPELYRMLKARADQDGRTLTKTVELLLRDAVQKGPGT
jgi:hypothetical protein